MNAEIKLHETVTPSREVAERLARQWSVGFNKPQYKKQYFTVIPYNNAWKVTNKFDPRVKYYENK